MDWTAYLKDTSGCLAEFRKEQPAAAKGFTGMHHAAMGDGALDVKTKELLALAIGVSQRCLDCIGFHVQAAKKAGATRAEVAETVSVAMMMGGGPAYMYGAKVLQAFDQLD
ncbi:MAG: carboxymuconolactone decarboxylase family protein [Marinibacterium sp.]|nr:carboxymuconolactone decarboxylase family protein [Marinibacterium sp.]